ncbi:MAG: DNA cytosine methyltransferase [Bacteroidales bacterium]|nr:DNA cytosine methyltransferase [Bacteroidales bacterium]
MSKYTIKEFHLFAGIGGGIYGGELLGHECCAGVEILPYAQAVLKQRQQDGWMPKFPIYGDIRLLSGKIFKNKFDILCGGFPCQAFSTAAHGKNIEEKNLWGEMLRFIKESNAPIVFAENVVLRAIDKAKIDLEQNGYKVVRCRLSCSDIGADHQRNRFWLLAVKNRTVFARIAKHVLSLPIIKGIYWATDIKELGGEYTCDNGSRRKQLLGIGNAQSPFVVASAFRILVNRMLNEEYNTSEIVSNQEIQNVFEIQTTWIQKTHNNIGLLHTPTTMANYSCPSMMKHQGCRNFKTVFGRPEPNNAEYLMGFPLGASNTQPMIINNFNKWKCNEA